MIIFYIIGFILFLYVFSAYLSNKVERLIQKIKFVIAYSKKLSHLKTRVRNTNFNEINSDLRLLTSEIKLNSQEFESIKANTVNTNQLKLDNYLSSASISDKFKVNELNK